MYTQECTDCCFQLFQEHHVGSSPPSVCFAFTSDSCIILRLLTEVSLPVSSFLFCSKNKNLERCNVVKSMRLLKREMALLKSSEGSWSIKLMVFNHWRTSSQSEAIIPVSRLSTMFTWPFASKRHSGFCFVSSLSSRAHSWWLNNYRSTFVAKNLKLTHLKFRL